MSAKGNISPVFMLQKSVAHSGDVDGALRHVAEVCRDYLGCSAVFVCCRWTSGETLYQGAISDALSKPFNPTDFAIRPNHMKFSNTRVLLPVFYTTGEEGPEVCPEALVGDFERRGILAAGLVCLRRSDEVVGWIECHYLDEEHDWTDEEKMSLQELADYCQLLLGSTARKNSKAKYKYPLRKENDANPSSDQEEGVIAGPGAVSEGATLPFQKVAEYGNLVIIKTDRKFAISDLFGDTEYLFGISREELLSRENSWELFVHPEDLRLLARKIRRMGALPGELSEEIRITHRGTKNTHWFILKAIPYYGRSGEFLGWEGFGVDITEKRRFQEDLIQQRRRLEALYEVSKALKVTHDPSMVTLKGLRTLIRATGSDGGFGCFYHPGSGSLEVVAAHGLSEEYLEAVEHVVRGHSLVRYCVEHCEGMLIDNIQKDSRASVDVARLDNLKATIVVPLSFEDKVVGALVLFCKTARKYSQADFDLVTAAANQIALAARQAEYYASEKRHASSVAVLYRLSHELSKLMSPKEVAEHAFPIIQEELACRRMWLGVINEQGTHLLGQGGVGPGVRKSIKELQVELDLRHDFLDKALRTKQTIVVNEGEEMECSGLNRITQRLKVGMFIIVPLVSLGQVVGVFIVEPAVSSRFFVQRKLPLLRSMANEIATVILARRFESKMADADKMRMAGLLASGVAHNFNNLLQAVMGQASLIEMQLDKGSPLIESAKTIVDAAGRGASLIKQLLSFSMQEGFEHCEVVVRDMLEESKELYVSLLGSNILLEMNCDDASASVHGDRGQLQQVVTNLLINAKEAIGNSPDGLVQVDCQIVRIRSGEVDPELAPGEYVRIDVEDNGIGMDAERCARCFEPFYTTKDVDKNTGIGLGGSGLGLSSAYSIVRQHGGTITVVSNPGEGTTFSVLLPRVSEQSRSAKELRVQRLQSPVIIFDLEDSVAYSVRSTLESLGLSSRIVSDRNRALKELGGEGSECELAIVDLDRFGEGVVSFLQSVISKNDKLVIIASSIDRLKWADRFSALKRVHLVEKPIGVWAIHSVVRKLLPLGEQNLADEVEVEIDRVSGNGSGTSIAPEVHFKTRAHGADEN